MYEDFINELADSSKIYDYELKELFEDGVKIYKAHFTTSSGTKYVCNMIDADDHDKNNLRKYSDKITNGLLKPSMLSKISLYDMSYYEMNFKKVGENTSFKELTGKGEMPSIVSTCFAFAKEVCALDGDKKLFGFHFVGTAKDSIVTKDATQRTKIYRYFVTKILSDEFKIYEDGNTTRVIRIK